MWTLYTAVFKSVYRSSYFALDLNVRFSHLLGILKLKKYLKIRFTGTTLHILKKIRLNYFRLNSSIFSQLYWSTEASSPQISAQRQQLLSKKTKHSYYFRLSNRNEFIIKQFFRAEIIKKSCKTQKCEGKKIKNYLLDT